MWCRSSAQDACVCPVRETAAQALAMVLRITPDDETVLQHIVGSLSELAVLCLTINYQWDFSTPIVDMYIFICVSQSRTEWDLRFSGLLGLKYVTCAISSSVMGSFSRYLVPVVVKGLDDK